VTTNHAHDPQPEDGLLPPSVVSIFQIAFGLVVSGAILVALFNPGGGATLAVGGLWVLGFFGSFIYMLSFVGRGRPTAAQRASIAWAMLLKFTLFLVGVYLVASWRTWLIETKNAWFLLIGMHLPIGAWLLHRALFRLIPPTTPTPLQRARETPDIAP